MNTDGKLICFCGIDGSGKSTHLKAVYEYLRNKNKNIKITTLVTKNGTLFKTLKPILGRISEQSYCDLFSFERYRTIQKKLKYELKKYDVVLNNRYLYTDLAYTMGYSQDNSFIIELLRLAPKPDLVLLFDIDANVAMDRIIMRGKEVFTRQENIELLRKTRNAYLDIAADNNFRIIDTTRPKEESIKSCIDLIEEILYE